VITKGDRSRLDVLNRFVNDACSSGLVKTSIDRAKLLGVDVARSGIK